MLFRSKQYGSSAGPVGVAMPSGTLNTTEKFVNTHQAERSVSGGRETVRSAHSEATSQYFESMSGGKE